MSSNFYFDGRLRSVSVGGIEDAAGKLVKDKFDQAQFVAEKVHQRLGRAFVATTDILKRAYSIAKNQTQSFLQRTPYGDVIMARDLVTAKLKHLQLKLTEVGLEHFDILIRSRPFVFDPL